MKTLDLAQILTQPTENHFIGLDITINQKLSQGDAIEYFQEKYSDEIGGTGHWMLRPKNDSSISFDYVCLGKGDEVREGAYSTVGDKTMLSMILFFNLDPEWSGEVLSMEEELKAISSELDDFCRTNDNDDWVQFNVNPVSLN